MKDTKIMVVDDDACVCDLLNDILELRYNNVKTALSPNIALEIFPKYCPDIMLVDFSMPVMDGYQLVKNLKDEGYGHDTVNILVSGGTAQDFNYYKEAIDSGYFSFFIQKPFNSHNLLDKMDYSIRNKDILIKKREETLSKSSLDSKIYE